jgi:hypothetical protein
MKRFIVACVAAACFVSSASAGEQLLFTKGASKSGPSLALDYMSDGKAVGLQIEIMAPVKGQLDFSGFGKNLPKGFVAEHSVVNGKIIAIVVNDRSEPLPVGMIELGTIKSRGGSGEFVLDHLEVADANARVISVETVQ